MSKRDYGQTSSVLLANQQFRYERELKTMKDKLWAMSGSEYRLRNEVERLRSFLEEKGLLDQWQTEE